MNAKALSVNEIVQLLKIRSQLQRKADEHVCVFLSTQKGDTAQQLLSDLRQQQVLKYQILDKIQASLHEPLARRLKNGESLDELFTAQAKEKICSEVIHGLRSLLKDQPSKDQPSLDKEFEKLIYATFDASFVQFKSLSSNAQTPEENHWNNLQLLLDIACELDLSIDRLGDSCPDLADIECKKRYPTEQLYREAMENIHVKAYTPEFIFEAFLRPMVEQKVQDLVEEEPGLDRQELFEEIKKENCEQMQGTCNELIDVFKAYIESEVTRLYHCH